MGQINTAKFGIDILDLTRFDLKIYLTVKLYQYIWLKKLY